MGALTFVPMEPAMRIVRVKVVEGLTVYVHSSDIVFHHVTTNVVAEMYGSDGNTNVFCHSDAHETHIYGVEATVVSSLPDEECSTLEGGSVHIYVQDPATVPFAAVTQ